MVVPVVVVVEIPLVVEIGIEVVVVVVEVVEVVVVVVVAILLVVGGRGVVEVVVWGGVVKVVVAVVDVHNNTGTYWSINRYVLVKSLICMITHSSSLILSLVFFRSTKSVIAKEHSQMAHHRRDSNPEPVSKTCILVCMKYSSKKH